MARTSLLYLVKKVVLQNYAQVCNKARYLSIITADKPISNQDRNQILYLVSTTVSETKSNRSNFILVIMDWFGHDRFRSE